jgi:putative ABC transport system permease protein
MPNLRLALRMLLRTPGLTAIAVLSLAFGIGANAAIFSLYNQMLLRPLPVHEPQRLVNLAAPGPKPGSQSSNQAGPSENTFSYQMFRDLERAEAPLSGVAAHRLLEVNLGFKGQTRAAQGMLVSGSYFGVLGLTPAAGRLLATDDDRTPGAHELVVLSHGYWQTQFAMSPAVIGDTMVVNGIRMTIIGVAPAGFTGTTLGALPAVFVPLSMRERLLPGFKGFENRRNYWAYLFARLKPGATIDQASAALNVRYRAIINDVEAGLQEGMSDATMTRFRAKQIVVTPGAQGQSRLMGEIARTSLNMLLAVTAFVLLIACANIANLLLARGASRASEMAVRLSIGASRWQVVRQLLTESALLAALGGLLGLIVARATLTGIIAMVPSEDTSWLSNRIDVPTLAFSAAVAIGTGLLFGLFPALHSTRPDLVTAIKSTAGQPSGARAASIFRIALATAQIALSTMLLILAGLFTKSLMNITRVDLGIDTARLVTFSLSPERNGYSTERSRALFERVEDELAAVPGVSGVGAGIVPLLAGNNWGSGVLVTGMKFDPDADDGSMYNEVSPGFFGTVGMRLLAGRDFTRSDIQGGPKVAIINEAFARKFKITGHEIGSRMTSNTGADAKLDIEIVGLVKDAKYSEVKREIQPVFFTPYRQDERLGGITFYARTRLTDDELLQAIPRLVARLDPNLPVEDLRTMRDQVRQNTGVDRLITILSASFAVVATLLAAIGLYGVLAYTVSQRTREIGLRMALGADAGRVRGLILGQVGWMTGIGAVVGIAFAITIGVAGGSLLYDLKGYDPAVLAASTALLVAVAFMAGLVPAVRASRVNPMTALRND